MKIIGRMLVILAAALVVVGIVLAIGSLGSAGTAAVATAATGAAAAGAMEMGHGMESSGFNLGGIVQILPHLAIIAVIIGVVAPIKHRLESKRQPNPARRPKQMPTTTAPSV